MMMMMMTQKWLATVDHRSASSSSGAWWQRLSLPHPVDVADVATPVGFLPSGPLVSLATLSVASAGALLLVFIAVSTTGGKKPNRKTVWMNGACAPKWKPKTS